MNKFVLSINAGSSSLKFRLYGMPQEQVLLSGLFDKINTKQMCFKACYGDDRVCEQLIGKQDFSYATHFLLSFIADHNLIDNVDDIYAVGHRVAHGGEKFDHSVIVNQEVLQDIDLLCNLAPLHNPNNLMCIKIFQQVLPNATQVAVFDTAFHQTLTEDKFLYPLPYELYQQFGIRKFGFHGISHQYVSLVVKQEFAEQHDWKVINCHLGNGASICAMLDGRSVDSSMGFTPLAGLMMGTRCGDIDPALPAYIAQVKECDIEEVVRIMNFESGLLGVSQLSNDCRTVQEMADKGDKQAQLALKMFINRVIATIGAYAASLNGVDLITFTGGIGENSDHVRREICSSLSYLGVHLVGDSSSNNGYISSEQSKVLVKVINTDEELMIARDAYQLLSS
ncbi:acetate/propionate family kinase [Vibrio sinensis]|nr:acetate kinase [Vibrio sinensis]